MITVEAFRMLNILDILSIAQLIMASKAAEGPSDSAGSGNSVKTEEPVAKDPPKEPVAKDPPKCDGDVGNGANTVEGAAATSESVGGSEEARSNGGGRGKRSSRLDRKVVVYRKARSGGFMPTFPVVALALTWGMWKLDRLERSQERKAREAAAQVLDDKVKKYVHEREALDSIMKDVAVIKEEVIKEKANKKGGLWGYLSTWLNEDEKI